jgi:SAM-dependent methyltransferase
VNPGSFARAPRFPAVGFASHSEFKSYLAANQSRLDARYEYELSLATMEAKIVRPGTCAPCLRPTDFVSETENGETLPDARRLPNWREEVRCGCDDRLINRQRAVVHFVQASGLLPWMRVLLFGTPGDADRRLESMVAKAFIVPRPSAPVERAHALPHLGLARSAVHLAVSQDYLQFVPPIGAVLSEICDALIDGGRFIFTVPFHFNEASTVPIPQAAMSFAVAPVMEFRGVPHRFGWDLLDLLKDAGFSDAAAYLYWSEELGYMGSMNFIFRAIK